MSDRGHCVLERARRAVARALLAAGCVVAASAQPDPQTLAQEARQAMAERRFAQAADLYAELAKSFPNQPSLQANLGMALHLSGRDREAIAPLQMAVSALSSSFQAHFFLGASLTRLGESAESVAPLRQAVRLNPKHPFARALLGDSLEAVGEFSEAVGSWRALRELEQANPYAHAGLVRSYEQLAAQAMDGLKERDPESVYVVRLLAESRMSTAQYPSALYLFRQALEREPGVRPLHESVAAIYERTGRTEWAAIERRRSASAARIRLLVVGNRRVLVRLGSLRSRPVSVFHSLVRGHFLVRSSLCQACRGLVRQTDLPRGIRRPANSCS